MSRVTRLDKTFRAFVENPRLVFLIALCVPLTLFIVIIYVTVSNVTTETKSEFLGFIPSTLSASAILFSALWASTFAVQSMRTARETARLQETLKLISHVEFGGGFIEAKDVWTSYRSKENHDKEFSILMSLFILGEANALPLEPNLEEAKKPAAKINPDINSEKITLKARKEAQLIITYLNTFEFVSIAMDKGIIDEDFYKEWYATNVVRIWNYSVGAIGSLRVLLSNPKLYEHWEKRANRWGPGVSRKVRDVPEYSLGDLAYQAYNVREKSKAS